jgi:hypothetical protein
MPTKSKCRVSGCPNRPLKDRLFCSEHIDSYGVGHVAYMHRKHAAKRAKKKKKRG